jgi:phosphate transport system permease protein
MPQFKTASTRTAKRRDKLARWVITFGGVTVIASVVAILALTVSVAMGLFRAPRADVVGTCRLGGPGGAAILGGASHGADGGAADGLEARPTGRPDAEAKVLRLGIDLDLDGANVTGFVWSADGSVAWMDLRTGKVLGRQRMSPPAGRAAVTLRRVEPLGEAKYSLAWSDGAASLVEIVRQRATAKDASSARRAADRAARSPIADGSARSPIADGSARSPIAALWVVRPLATIPAIKNQQPRQVFARRSDAGVITRAALLSDGAISILRQSTTESLTGDEEVTTHETVLREGVIGHIRAMAMDREGGTLYAGTDDGRLARWQFDEQGEVAHREQVRAFADGRAVTALALVLGDVSLAVGDAQGQVTVWSPVNADGARKLQMIHQLEPHRSAIREMLASGRNKSILSLSEDGVVHLDHATSERHLLALDLGGAGVAPARTGAGGTPAPQVALGPRGDALLALDAAGNLTAWQLEGGCPEISFKTLFGKVFYEGYDRPEYVWQTTGGEDFEPKLSLVPLLFGTLKGTFYAMLLAVPLALFGAMYVSYFTTPQLRGAIKPAIEVMASVPSVVIGFLVALWLAPILERWLFAFFLGLVAVPAALAAFMFVWQLVRGFGWAKRMEHGYEFLVVLPVLLAGAGLAVCLAAPLEKLLFGSNFRRWLFEGPLGMQYDQRNCILIAFGLGFTVIPIIFSIAEDSLSNVPYSMTAASMAVGASRWQTLWRVVLPSASPGIFAATMIGFGRAVGETMIVLMATGNTPILDWSPFNGMRTLSANIAVEIPEAPVGGTLYRVLFLCAVLLFLLTFTVNTAAELVRQRLRKRFGRF